MGIEVRGKGVTGGERDCILFCGGLFLYICHFLLVGIARRMGIEVRVKGPEK